jgi:serine/threonine protein kinase
MAVDFIRQCTRRNPRERPTARELLVHPWIVLAPDSDGDEDADEVGDEDADEELGAAIRA